MRPKSCWMRCLRRDWRALHAATGTPGVNKDHDLNAFAHPSGTDAIAATLGFGTSAIDQAVIEAKPAGVFHIASCSLHQGLKDSSLNPFEKPTLNGTLWSKTRGRSFQFAPLSSTSYRQAVLPRQCAKTYRDDPSPRARLSGLAHCKFIRYERPGFRLIQNFPLLGGLQNESS
jgi:hypothetical protein